MKIPYNLTGILSAFVVVLSVIGLIASPIGASVTTPGPDLTSGSSLMNPGHRFPGTIQTTHFESMIAALGQQGVDVAEPEAALSVGNLTAVSQWFRAYRTEHPVAAGNRTRYHPVNTTLPTARLQSVITAPGQKGCDVTVPRAAPGVGNLTAAGQWIKTCQGDHPVAGGNRTRFQPANTTLQTIRFQSVITAFGQKGVDTTVPQAALTSGNLTAVSQWFKAYRTEHPGNGTPGAWPYF